MTCYIVSFMHLKTSWGKVLTVSLVFCNTNLSFFCNYHDFINVSNHKGLLLQLCCVTCLISSSVMIRYFWGLCFLFFPFLILWDLLYGNPGDQCILSLKLFLYNFKNIPKVVWVEVVIQFLTFIQGNGFFWRSFSSHQRLKNHVVLA